MTAIHRIEPPIELDTPRGRAAAYFLLDYGTEESIVWVCFQRETGECWSYKNPVVRKVWCETMGTGKQPSEIPTWAKDMTPGAVKIVRKRDIT